MTYRTYFTALNRLDEAETDVVVKYTYHPGCAAQTYGPAENCYPAEPAEVEIVSARDAAGVTVTLTAAEEDKFREVIAETHEEEEPDYDDR